MNAYDAHLHQADDGAVVHRPPAADEPGFRLERQEGTDRQIRYTTHSYATERPVGRAVRGT